jgi:O-antigen/teichoic acid export membrane protein
LIRFYFERKTEFDKQKLVGNIFLFIAFVNVFIFISGFLIIPKLISFFKIKILWNPYFKLAFIAYFLDVFSIIPLVLYRVKQNAKVFVALSLIKVIFQYVIIFILIVFYKKGLLGYYYGNIFALIPFFFIYWFIIYKNSILNFNWKEIKVGLIFSLPLLPGAVSYLLLSFSDRILLERYVPMSDIGIYSIAYTLSFSLNMVIYSVYKAIEPEIFIRYGTLDFERFILKSKSVFFLIIYSAAMFVSLFSQEFFSLVTSKSYMQAYLYVPFIIIGVIMTGQNVIFGGILTAEKRTKIVGFSTFLGVIVSLAFNLLFIPHYGAFAAAISSAISFGVVNLFLYFNMNFSKKSLKKEAIALGVYLLIIIFIFFILQIHLSIIFTLSKVIIFLIYIFILKNIFNIKYDTIFLYLKYSLSK